MPRRKPLAIERRTAADAMIDQEEAKVTNSASWRWRHVDGILRRACIQEDWRRVKLGIEAVLNMAAQGDKWAITFIAERLDGKPRQQLELGPDAIGGGITIRIEYAGASTPLPDAIEGHYTPAIEPEQVPALAQPASSDS